MKRVHNKHEGFNVVALKQRLYRNEREPSAEPWAGELEHLIDDVIPTLRATTAVSLIILWRHADRDGYTESSVNLLSVETGSGRSTAYRSLQELVRRGLIEVVSRRGGQPTLFRVVLDQESDRLAARLETEA